MIKLRETNENQTITFIPRYYNESATYSLKITTEGSGVVVYDQQVTEGFETEKYYYKHTDQFNLKTDTTYELEIDHDDTVIYKDRILVTNQSGDYSINDQVYTYKSTQENTTENDFKFYS
jgi:hypothetical protein